MHNRQTKGFTLIELIMVIVIIGILSTITTDLITLPVKSYLDLERRTTLVDSAEMSLRRMQRDIRRALPNSIIANGGTTIELLHTSEGGRYRANVSDAGLGDILDFTTADAQFDVIGPLSTTPSGYLVIYNTGTLGANAYAHDNLVSINKGASTLNSIQLTTAKRFPYRSPQQRFFIVDTPITYSCTNGELRRYDNKIDSSYTISSPSPSLSRLRYKLQAKAKMLSCQFDYDPGSATRAALVTIEIKLTDDAGESVKLIHQVHVDNMP
ncbi:type II secretion system protein [methanotrophic endosymbiont of Bathymodiolus puteoserpentis (Logatchev)]|jgi:MSHA biogenesis protein MshO|uniref:type II secretion system protein n=1 Tax=methanotrophic endosymbiont of Bathymodiolus puteoserpentis (Logatchev) TaxID=343235 RepID=UPI0013C9904E|nr:type II secretion system protein [methanotrophic endosymbiont of Bathymodiolus puteoserpentis (Logatchev)]SHE20806.1 MSHA biogenesis protein MshO [methanotrophic endosymbiont of Bathymodiolus puteoserpentis (Logatchev)]